MRLRKVAGAEDRLNENKTYFVSSPEENKGIWKSVFSNENQLHVEIGCGKGGFIVENAKKNPNINFIAIEKYDSVLIRVLEKIENEDIPNLRLVLFDANDISLLFGDKEVDTIYLNFSDPWPKNKHARRRLTSSIFLNQYKNILSDNGQIIQKTDNRHLFESSLESFCNNGWSMFDISLDLHKEDEPNICTEYEEKFSKFGPIYRLKAKLKK